LETKSGLSILEFPDSAAWGQWLAENHADIAGIWLKHAKKDSGAATVSYPEALEEALCYGWIDGQKAAYDDAFWLQRYTPRGPRSKWSQVNRQAAEGLIATGRMKPAGLAAVNAAESDGRWEQAYEPQSRATVPDDLQRELDRNPEAAAFFATLRGAARYAFLYRLQNVRTPEGRAKRIASYIALLNEGKTLQD
jgi:uncharacterized protein YdeI (YjbR/CyaY-like superfamily)